MKIYKPFIFFLFLFSVISLSQEKIDFSIISNEICINSNATYFIKSNTENDLKNTKKTDYNDFIKITEYPIQTKAIWLKINIDNTNQDSLFLYSKDRIAKFEVFEYNNKFISLGKSGYANRLSVNSIKNEIYNIRFLNNIKKDIFIKVTTEMYEVEVPKFYISKHHFVNNDDLKSNTITLIVCSIEISFLLLSLLIIFFKLGQKLPSYFLFFIIISISDLLYFFSRSNILIFESDFFPNLTNSNVWNVLGNFNIFLYYLFFGSFFTILKKSFTYKVIIIGVLFWIGQCFVELSHFNSIGLINFAKHYLHFSAIVDFAITSIICIYIFKNRITTIYQKIASVGVFLFVLSAFQIALPRIIDLFHSKIGWESYSFNDYLSIHFIVIINILAFVTSILYKYSNYEKENLKIKTQLLEKEIERQQSLENERTRIAHDMHDDLGSGLTKITYLSQMAINDKDNSENLSKIKQTSADLIESMSEIIWAMKEDNNTLEDLVTYIKTYASEYLDSNNIELLISIPENYNTIIINGNHRKNIFLCVKESLHNIVKHAKAKAVSITITCFEILEINILDDGIGYKNNQFITKKPGNGLLNMKLRMEKIGGQMEMIDDKGTLTRFMISIEKFNL